MNYHHLRSVNFDLRSGLTLVCRRCDSLVADSGVVTDPSSRTAPSSARATRVGSKRCLHRPRSTTRDGHGRIKTGDKNTYRSGCRSPATKLDPHFRSLDPANCKPYKKI